jgi:hypothetical protein
MLRPARRLPVADHAVPERAVNLAGHGVRALPVVDVGPVTPQLARLVRRPFALAPDLFRIVTTERAERPDRTIGRLLPGGASALRRPGPR